VQNSTVPSAIEPDTTNELSIALVRSIWVYASRMLASSRPPGTSGGGTSLISEFVRVAMTSV
jgi:hypothetical protein